MPLGPILDASAIIQFHLAAALPALLLGPVVIWGRLPQRWHKRLGYGWVASMALLAGSGLFIPSHGLAVIGPLGPIHLLSLMTFWGIGQGVWFARQGRVQAHQQAMRAVWFWALGIAGLFTLAPGRLMNELLLAGGTLAAVIVIGAGIVAVLLLARLTPRPFRTRHSGDLRVFALEKDQTFD
ncbi:MULTISPECIES: DUF2306 domain-containing protein [unclassified Yoonia]|uniref:DUF2306 domain-containing protein n=1 Tax=unclassified Yoonia TaxID=2629118 RepID=UPI002AFE95F8|nr:MULTISPECIES: DUF2306 domain-containing protein [unclassified Yoonia]